VVLQIAGVVASLLTDVAQRAKVLRRCGVGYSKAV